MKIELPKTAEQAEERMFQILDGQHSTENLVELLKYYQDHPPGPETMRAFLEAIIKTAAVTVQADSFSQPMLDIAGTGGDGMSTVNISTLAGLFCAATGLVRVAKYGNRSASGVCGSMDILEAVGIPIKIPLAQIEENLGKTGFSPLFARSAYPGAKHVAAARSQVSGPTIFNTLFPLARPVSGDVRFVFGVADAEKIEFISELYMANPKTRCILVHGSDGTDEVSVTGSGETVYSLIDGGVSKSGVFNALNCFKFEPIAMTDLQVSSKLEAVSLFMKVCDPSIDSDRISAIRKSVFANAAIALFISLNPENFELEQSVQYIEVLEKALVEGKVLQLIKQLQLVEEGDRA